MPNDERILETMPTGTLGLIPTASCMELGKKVDSYLSTWREHREHEHHNDIAFKEYHKESYIIEPHIPRFGSGEAKCVINQSVRGYDLYIMVDVTNYSMTYSLCGHTNHMSPDDHFADLKRVIAAVGGKARRITVILPFLYESRQHRRTARESLDCPLALQELYNMGIDNIITFDAHDPRVQNAIPLNGFETIRPTYQFVKGLLRTFKDLQIDSDHMMAISPDEGGTNRAVYLANVLGLDMGMFYKRRDYTQVVDGRNPIVAHEFLGSSVEGKDVIIIDEMSMVDIHLMHSLLLAVVAGTRLILVGDENQLPSVGPGNVLRDIIRSRCFHVVELTKIFRQASESDIVVNAHKINKGEQVQINNKSRDFFFLKRYDADIIIRVVIALIQEKLPRYVDAKPFEIQVLTPMRKGLLGVERLNQILQRYLNPPEDGKSERAVGDRLFRTGDKVMQIRNNYQMEWEIRGRYGVVIEKGVGVFNGDTGILREINEFAETAEVEFEDGRFAMYSFKQLEELELAYAITIHKSQGSEYPAVILPLLSGPQMLLNRNLLYTAVTRARKCVTVVGKEETFAEMIRNEKQQKRYSALDERIRELSETTGDNNTDGEE